MHPVHPDLQVRTHTLPLGFLAHGAGAGGPMGWEDGRPVRVVRAVPWVPVRAVLVGAVRARMEN